MDHAFWLARWQEGRIGFHEGKPNTFLAAHGDWLADCRRILVPLCGKTEDLAYLAGRGHEVIGIELVEDAVRQFFAEHAITPSIERAGELTAYTAGPRWSEPANAGERGTITVLAGDVFATTAALVGPIDGVFDRAALVALPPELRTRYVAHLRSIAPSAERELLVSLDYPAGSMDGPPFSVDEAEVRLLFSGASVQLLAAAPDPAGRAGGQMMERCYSIAFQRA